MKKHLLTIFTLAFGLVASAQLPSGSLAPNFIATDLNGEQHELYEYLQEGYTVVLDISATWCGPCWAYHTGAYNGTDGEGALHVLWAEHGVENGGNVVVLMIEGDGTTNTDCLYALSGCNSSTQGDWVTGTPYPIIDDSSISSAYQIGYYPTIYTICPNGIVTETSQITAADHWAFIENSTCQTVGQNDAMLLDYQGTTNSCDVADIVVEIANVGSSTLTGLNITVTGVTPGIDYDWTGMLEIFETATIDLGTVTVNDGEEVVITITTSDDNLLNNILTPNVGAVESTTHLHIELQTDVYPGDYVIHVYDDQDNEVLVAGPWAEFDVQLEAMLINEDHSFPDLGCYRVVLEDMFGDGLYDGAYCKVYGIDSDGNNMDLILDVLPSTFSEVEGAAEVTEIISVRESDMINMMEVFPNPTDGLLNVRFGLKDGADMRAEVLNILGESVLGESFGKLSSGEHMKQIDLGNLGSGVYLVNLVSNGQVSSFRVNVN